MNNRRKKAKKLFTKAKVSDCIVLGGGEIPKRNSSYSEQTVSKTGLEQQSGETKIAADVNNACLSESFSEQLSGLVQKLKSVQKDQCMHKVSAVERAMQTGLPQLNLAEAVMGCRDELVSKGPIMVGYGNYCQQNSIKRPRAEMNNAGKSEHCYVVGDLNPVQVNLTTWNLRPTNMSGAGYFCSNKLSGDKSAEKEAAASPRKRQRG